MTWLLYPSAIKRTDSEANSCHVGGAGFGNVPLWRQCTGKASREASFAERSSSPLLLCLRFRVAMTTGYNFLICCASVHFQFSGRNTTQNDPLHNPNVPTYQLASFLSRSLSLPPILWQPPRSDTNSSLFNNIATDCHKPSLPGQLMTRIRETVLTGRQWTSFKVNEKHNSL